MILPKSDIVSQFTEDTKPDHLISPPTTTPPEAIKRAHANYTNLSEKFKLRNKCYKRQYAPLYAVRLSAMRPMLEGVARDKWFDVPIVHLNDIQQGKTCVIIGTLFKQMQLKPNILRELSEDINLPPKPERKRYTHTTDILYLEDETQRISLVSNITAKESITGTVICAKGKEKGDKFHIEEWAYCGLPAQLTSELAEPIIEDKYVAIISGISLGDPKYDPMPLQLFVDLITGQLGSLKDQTFYSKVVRLIVAGDSLSKCTRDSASVKQAKYLSKNVKARSISAAQELDDVLTQLVSCIFVDLMPGEYDPASFALPQQPLHRCIFPQAAQYTSFQSVTNPYEAEIDGITFLGTSGQNIKDIKQYTDYSDSTDIAEVTLKCRHIAPTCPDTLGCYPYVDEDPFIMRDCPHVYFVGNQKKYGSRMVTGDQGQKTLVVSIPKFFETNQVVLVNLKDLSSFPVSVSTLIGEGGDMEKMTVDSSDEEGEDQVLPDVNILPDDDIMADS